MGVAPHLLASSCVSSMNLINLKKNPFPLDEKNSHGLTAEGLHSLAFLAKRNSALMTTTTILERVFEISNNSRAEINLNSYHNNIQKCLFTKNFQFDFGDTVFYMDR